MVKVAVIGVGHLGKQHARLYSELEGVELAGVVDILKPRAEEFALLYKTTAYTDYHDVLGKVDAVSLAVPTTEHARLGVELLDHGVDVLVEKPIASTIANARVEFEDGCVANFTASRVSFEKIRKLRFFQPHDYISVDYASQTGTMVSLRMGRVTERKLEPAIQEPLKVEIQAFVECVQKRGKPAVSGEDGLRALELAMRINAAIAERLVLR